MLLSVKPSSLYKEHAWESRFWVLCTFIIDSVAVEIHVCPLKMNTCKQTDTDRSYTRSVHPLHGIILSNWRSLDWLFFFLISALMSFQGYIGLQRSLCQFHYCFEPRSAFTILYLTLLLVLMLFQVKMTHCIFESEVLENKCSVINAFSFSHSHTCIHIHPASYCYNSAVWIRSSIHKAASLSVSFQPLSKGYSGIRERLAVCSDFYAMQRSLPYKRTKRLLH